MEKKRTRKGFGESRNREGKKGGNQREYLTRSLTCPMFHLPLFHGVTWNDMGQGSLGILADGRAWMPLGTREIPRVKRLLEKHGRMEEKKLGEGKKDERSQSQQGDPSLTSSKPLTIGNIFQ